VFVIGVPLPLQIASGLFAAHSAVFNARAQSGAMRAQAQQHEFQAEVARQNQEIARIQQAEALAMGARDEARFRRQAEQFQESQKAAISASGALLSGTNLEILAETAGGIEQDVAQLRYNALKNMWGFQMEETNLRHQEALERHGATSMRRQARAARTAGFLGAGSALARTGANIWGTQHTTLRNGRLSIAGGTTPFHSQQVPQQTQHTFLGWH